MTPEEIDVYVRTAMNRAFNRGSLYWQQADSEFWSEQDKAGVTHSKFKDYVNEVASTLSALGDRK